MVVVAKVVSDRGKIARLWLEVWLEACSEDEPRVCRSNPVDSVRACGSWRDRGCYSLQNCRYKFWRR